MEWWTLEGNLPDERVYCDWNLAFCRRTPSGCWWGTWHDVAWTPPVPDPALVRCCAGDEGAWMAPAVRSPVSSHCYSLFPWPAPAPLYWNSVALRHLNLHPLIVCLCIVVVSGCDYLVIGAANALGSRWKRFGLHA